MRRLIGLLGSAGVLMIASCSSSSQSAHHPNCDAEPVVRTTPDGVEFVRTPGGCLGGLAGFDYELKNVEIDGLRQGYVDEGPADADPVLLLQGQPSWAYLYRKMIPVLVDAGHRVIAMDHIGLGSSDKPIDIEYYSYVGHVDRLEKFIDALGLRDITMFAKDWGSLIGLKVAGENPDWFARIVIGDGTLPVFPEGVEPYPRVENPNEIDPDLEPVFAAIPPQQPRYCEVQQNLIDNVPGAEGLPHTRLPEASHFLQDDQGAEIALQIVELIEATP